MLAVLVMVQMRTGGQTTTRLQDQGKEAGWVSKLELVDGGGMGEARYIRGKKGHTSRGWPLVKTSSRLDH